MSDLKTGITEMGGSWRPRFIHAVRNVRQIRPASLTDTLTFMAEIFSFKDDEQSELTGWRQFRQWCDSNQVSLESAQGPHAITILKAIAAKHGRLNVSTQR